MVWMPEKPRFVILVICISVCLFFPENPRTPETGNPDPERASQGATLSPRGLTENVSPQLLRVSAPDCAPSAHLAPRQDITLLSSFHTCKTMRDIKTFFSSSCRICNVPPPGAAEKKLLPSLKGRSSQNPGAKSADVCRQIWKRLKKRSIYNRFQLTGQMKIKVKVHLFVLPVQCFMPSRPVRCF
jgi:hypothetical protein